MKKMLLIAGLFPVALSAQKSMIPYYNMRTATFADGLNYYDEQAATLKVRQKLHISAIDYSYTSRKGKVKETHYTYNRLGRILHSSVKDRTSDYTYQDDSLLTSLLVARKGKLFKTDYTYLNGQIASREIYKNGKLESRLEFAYNADNKVTLNKMSTGKKRYEIKYVYNEENKLIRTTYLINGKTKKEWVYECKPEGQILASKTEALSSVCNYRAENADGSYTTFHRTLEKGKPYLLKQTFTKDSVQVLAQRFWNDSILFWEMKKENNVETVVSFKKSGKRNYKQVSICDDAGNLISREYFAGNRERGQSKTVFELNPDGTTKTRTFSWKGKLRGTTLYKYSFY